MNTLKSFGLSVGMLAAMSYATIYAVTPSSRDEADVSALSGAHGRSMVALEVGINGGEQGRKIKEKYTKVCAANPDLESIKASCNLLNQF